MAIFLRGELVVDLGPDAEADNGVDGACECWEESEGCYCGNDAEDEGDGEEEEDDDEYLPFMAFGGVPAAFKRFDESVAVDGDEEAVKEKREGKIDAGDDEYEGAEADDDAEYDAAEQEVKGCGADVFCVEVVWYVVCMVAGECAQGYDGEEEGCDDGEYAECDEGWRGGKAVREAVCCYTLAG